ncbi:hypothetical protein SKAU_G00173780 [Synaphobranchus kaupii]|uniref:Uncharacterized protein n=1 Tax=Synaphobranchus kaupii TaxID=118154 RepID=A0A9Q1FL93_SYNKA|nr:hypothetical protein SKAU_G00173780 [Synaphobranchus kaupii]
MPVCLYVGSTDLLTVCSHACERWTERDAIPERGKLTHKLHQDLLVSRVPGPPSLSCPAAAPYKAEPGEWQGAPAAVTLTRIHPVTEAALSSAGNPLALRRRAEDKLSSVRYPPKPPTCLSLCPGPEKLVAVRSWCSTVSSSRREKEVSRIPLTPHARHRLPPFTLFLAQTWVASVGRHTQSIASGPESRSNPGQD